MHQAMTFGYRRTRERSVYLRDVPKPSVTGLPVSYREALVHKPIRLIFWIFWSYTYPRVISKRPAIDPPWGFAKLSVTGQTVNYTEAFGHKPNRNLTWSIWSQVYLQWGTLNRCHSSTHNVFRNVTSAKVLTITGSSPTLYQTHIWIALLQVRDT